MTDDTEKPVKKSPGMGDIAKLVGVSKNTVSLALRDSPLISQNTKKKILKATAQIGYEKNKTFSKFMSEIKTVGLTRYRETIALINANEDKNAFSAHPTIPRYVEGIRKAAKREGFALDEFWLHDPSLNGKQFVRIFKSRGIRGGVITGLMNNNRLPTKHKELWDSFKFVVTGVRTYGPTLNFTIADHFLIAYQATLQALEHGYERPALILDKEIDDLIEGRFTGGFLRAQMNLPTKNRIEPFFQVREAHHDISLFQNWFTHNKPDALVCLYNSAQKWIADMGLKVPEDIALIQLERRESESEWAGMDQRNDLAGEAAVERLAQLLYSVPNANDAITATLVSPTWIEAETICRKKAPK